MIQQGFADERPDDRPVQGIALGNRFRKRGALKGRHKNVLRYLLRPLRARGLFDAKIQGGSLGWLGTRLWRATTVILPAVGRLKVRFGGTPKPARETRALPGNLFRRA